MPVLGVSLPRLGHELVPKTELAVTRPALERAGYRCEHCLDRSQLRVVRGVEVTMVLCPECRCTGGFEAVFAARRRKR